MMLKQKWSVLLAEGVVGFVFELLFYICPKSSSSMRNLFCQRLLNLYKIVLLGYIVSWRWTSAFIWNKSSNECWQKLWAKYFLSLLQQFWWQLLRKDSSRLPSHVKRNPRYLDFSICCNILSSLLDLLLHTLWNEISLLCDTTLQHWVPNRNYTQFCRSKILHQLNNIVQINNVQYTNSRRM